MRLPILKKEMIKILIETSIILFSYFTIWYIVSVILKNGSIIDIGWGLGFVILAWIGYLRNMNLPTTIVTILVSIWGLRLSYQIFKRNYKKPEDFRYANFRKEWGKTYYLRAYFQLFLFQGVLMFLISLSFLYLNQELKIYNTYVFIIGITIWIFGFLFEAISDYQLKSFIINPKNEGKIINSGLWKYSRHPNYFGEATLWWGIFLMAIACDAPFFTIISPLTITLLIRFVSGVPMLEKGLANREGFEDYKKRTNIFFPWFEREVK